MEINNIFYGILLYIIIIASLVFTKPDFIYDHDKSKYKEFGTAQSRTIFTLPVLAIFLAVVISVVFAMIPQKKKETVVTPVAQQQIQYVPVPYYQPAPILQSAQPAPQYQFVYDPRIIPQQMTTFSSSISPITSPSNTPQTPQTPIERLQNSNILPINALISQQPIQIK